MKIIFIFILCINNIVYAQTNYFQKVDSLLTLGNYNAALKIVEKDTNSFKNLLKIGAIYQKIGHYSNAIIAYEKALKINTSAYIKESLGKCYQQNGKIDKAIVLFKEALEKNKSNLLLQYHLEKLYRSKKDYKNAKKLFVHLIEKDAANPNYLYYLGSVFSSLKNKDSAKYHYLKGYNLDTVYFKNIYALVKLYRIYDKDSSYLFLKKGLIISPQSNSLNQLGAKFSFKDKKYEDAIAFIKKLKNPKGEYLQLLGIAYYYNEQHTLAKETFKNLPRKIRMESKTFYYLSLTYKAVANYKEAEFNMFMAISAEIPQLTSYYYQLGLIQQKAKNYKRAIKSFGKSVKEDQYNNDAQYQLAITCDSFYKDKKIALAHYKTYLDKFDYKDKQTAIFVKQRVDKLTKKLFLEGN